MATNENSSRKNSEDRGSWVTIAVAALGILGTLGSGALGYQSGSLTVNKDYAQMAMQNLQDESASPELRRWSVDVLNKLAPVPFDDELKDQLIVNRFIVPEPSANMRTPCRDVRLEIREEGEEFGARPSDKEIAQIYVTAYEECKFRHSNLIHWLNDHRHSLYATGVGNPSED